MTESLVGVKLLLSGRGEFSAAAKATGQDIKNIGKAAGEASTTGTKHLGILGKGFGALLGVAKYAAIGVLGVVGTLATMGVKEAMDIQKTTAQTNAVIKSTGGIANVSASHVKDLGTQIMSYSGISADVVRQSSNLLLGFTKIRNEAGAGNDVFDRTNKIAADMSVRLGRDMPAVALMVGKALQDPAKGLTMLRRSGVVFSAEQIAMVKHLTETNNTLGAQKYILDQLNQRFGGAAAAYGKTLPGSIARFHGALKELTAGIMGGLMKAAANPVASMVTQITKLETTIPKTFNKIRAAFSSGGVKGGAGVIDQMLGGGGHISGLIQDVVRLFQSLWSIIKSLAPDVMTIGKWMGILFGGAVIGAAKVLADVFGFLAKHMGIVKPLMWGIVAAFLVWKGVIMGLNLYIKAITIVQAIWNAVMSANPIVLIVGLIILLGVAFIYAYRHSKTFRDIVQTVFRYMKTAVMDVWHAVDTAFRFIMKIVSGVVSWIGDHWKLLLAILTGPFGLVIYFVVSHFSQIIDFIAGVGKRIGAVGAKMWDWIKTGFKAVINTIIGYWDDFTKLLRIPSFTIGWGPAKVHFGGLDIGKSLFIPPLAGGGTLTKSGLVSVGEQGRELAVLPSAASIIPNQPANQIMDLLSNKSSAAGPPQIIQLVVDRRVLAQVVVDAMNDKAARL